MAAEGEPIREVRFLVPAHLEGAEKPYEIACWNVRDPLKAG
jgi:hypothetical protein